jgi:peptidoglycan hydrolase-like protein with peptidoglycan-binding domain
VAVWQRRLNKVRRRNLAVDGDFGPATHAATVAFQRNRGIGPVGLGTVGPRTRAAMERALH